MKKYILIGVVILSSCVNDDKFNELDFNYINFSALEDISIRALEVDSSGKIYFSGSNSTFGVSSDEGKTWKISQIDTLNQEYRSLAITENSIFIVNVASPANILKSEDMGETWKTVYSDTSSLAFYNSIKFWDNKHGIISGDPQSDCLSILYTSDYGNTWKKIDCNELPKTEEGEAQFAASNTCIEVINDSIWITTGGMNSRIISSYNSGSTWNSTEVNFTKGKQMTGIYSIDFYDSKRGFIAGGDWNEMCSTDYNKFYTEDGGQNWIDVKDFNVGYLSCVQYKPNSNAQTIIGLSMQGIVKSEDYGKTWRYISKEQDLYTFRFIDDKNIIAAGKGKMVSFEI